MAKRRSAAAKLVDAKPNCGIVMPISERDGCSSHHWLEVLSILKAGAKDAGYDADLVSNAEHIGVIHQTIVDNLYDNPIVICDVSTENPNVMFELGLRLAFDKPTIVVIDDQTKISFDASPIEHLTYPRDLRYASIVKFQSTLAGKIKSTIKRFEEPDCVTFLRSFKRFTAAKLESTELPKSDLILKELEFVRHEMSRLRTSNFPSNATAHTEKMVERMKQGFAPGGKEHTARMARMLRDLLRKWLGTPNGQGIAPVDLGDMCDLLMSNTEFVDSFPPGMELTSMKLVAAKMLVLEWMKMHNEEN